MVHITFREKKPIFSFDRSESIVYRRLTMKGGRVTDRATEWDTDIDASTPNRIDPDRLAAICKALAHPARIRIVGRLRQLNRCVCGDLVDALPLAQSTVSQHLKILKSAGVVRGEIEGPRTCYCLNPFFMKEFQSLVDQLLRFE